jgi:hypothetical protein
VARPRCRARRQPPLGPWPGPPDPRRDLRPPSPRPSPLQRHGPGRADVVGRRGVAGHALDEEQPWTSSLTRLRWSGSCWAWGRVVMVGFWIDIARAEVRHLPRSWVWALLMLSIPLGPILYVADRAGPGGRTADPLRFLTPAPAGDLVLRGTAGTVSGSDAPARGPAGTRSHRGRRTASPLRTRSSRPTSSGRSTARHDRARGGRPPRAARDDLRADRTQRRRQDHDAVDPRRPAPSHVRGRSSSRSRAARSASSSTPRSSTPG